LESIDLTSLPRTFMDAITFTRKLGLKCLWIDSLCIIQDDEHDWRHEASLMAHVHENAVLTTGAIASGCVAEGLFRASASVHEPMELHGQFYTVYARRPLPHRELHNEPLFKRAWIFQERYLSPRFLHFAFNELIWKCKEGIECECNQDGESKTMDTVDAGFSGSIIHSKHISRVHIAWRMVVEDYTNLNLSYATDRLPALSGIPKRFMAIRPGDTYIAGLWRHSLLRDLLWRRPLGVESEINFPPRSRRWRVPSWSWASIDFAVLTGNDHFGYDHIPEMTYCIDVLDISCVRAGGDVTGEVTSGYLTVRGSTMKGYLRTTQGNFESPYSVRGTAKENLVRITDSMPRTTIISEMVMRSSACVSRQIIRRTIILSKTFSC
ncbi:hypothetical protein EK21DRAFT_65452, partial [Setomelanomma holmii]